MERTWKRILTVLLALMLCCAVPMQAFASEISGTVDVETTAGSEEPVDVHITIEKTENADGTTTTDTVTVAEGETTESGRIVDYSGSSSETADASGKILSGTENTAYSVVDDSGTSGADGGSESVTDRTDTAPHATVEVPLTEGASDRQSGDASTEPVADGDTPADDTDGTYDYTVTWVEDPGSVAVETTDITLTNNKTQSGDLTNLHAEVAPSEDNDLLWESEATRAPAEYLPGSTGGIDPASDTGDTGDDDYYEYVYIGTGNTSQFWPAVVFTEPLTEEELKAFGMDKASGAYINQNADKFLKFLPEGTAATDENGEYKRDAEGFVLDAEGNRILKAEQTVVGPDGKTYYLHRIDTLATNHNAEGWHQDGEWVKELNGKDKYGVVYAVAQQFVLKGKETGNPITAFCADIETHAHKGFEYKMENLEDAHYYTEEQAKMIRSVAMNGYWGIKDDPETEEAEMGSLEAMKQTLRGAVDENGSRIFTDEEIDASLSDGVALSATQMAIWSFSNHMIGAEFINAHHIKKTDTFESVSSGWRALKNIPADKEDEVKLMFKIYEYLTDLAPTEKDEDSSSDTVITADNFIKDLSITVLEKDMEHENNKDDNDDNDAYVTSLSFALVVTPDEQDTMLVTVIKDGKEVAKGRIMGDLQDGEVQLTRDADGNYTFPEITLTEGEQSFNITLSGVQNLDQGVYLYTSEIKDGESSQTLVGIAEGTHAVDVSMNISFNLSVDDTVVTKERVWRTEWTESGNGGFALSEDLPEEKDPSPTYTITVLQNDTVVIDEEAVPLADAVPTGDRSFLFAGIAIAAAMGLLILALLGRRAKQN